MQEKGKDRPLDTAGIRYTGKLKLTCNLPMNLIVSEQMLDPYRTTDVLFMLWNSLVLRSVCGAVAKLIHWI